MPTILRLLLGLSIAVIPLAASAQVSIGGLPVGVPGTGPLLEPVLGDRAGVADNLTRSVTQLAQDRLRRIDRLVRQNRDVITRDARGEPARPGELVLMDADSAAIAAGEAAGYRVIDREMIDGLDLEIVRIALPAGTSLAEAEEELAGLMPQASISADNLYFQQGGAGLLAAQATAPPRASGARVVPIGMIDGAPGPAVPVAAIRGFADGAGVASNHGSAIASLLSANGATRILAADVYGTDRAGGNALALARALGWLAGQGALVVTVSLVGPDNAVLERAVAAARQLGVVVVAAVGNDGPAAPAAFPASYDGVIAVTAVDRRERALIEAGRAAHLDYAAPGADIYALDRRGRSVEVRGTSYATPLVAVRIARALQQGRGWRSELDSEAVDLGERGADPLYGRGLVCRGCSAER